MKRSVRLEDVARAAGVSQGTASNAFNRPELVRPELRGRIEEAAARLGYHGPDPKARILRAGRVNAIGVVVMDDLGYFFSDPFNREFMAGVAAVCDARAAGIALVSGRNSDAAAWGIGSAVVDGFILQCIEGGDRLLDLAGRRGLPFVALDLDPGPEASAIFIDEEGGARAAAAHLLGLGHRRIGILALEVTGDGRIGPVDAARRKASGIAISRARLEGYEAALAAGGIAIDSLPIVETVNHGRGPRAGAAMILDAAPGLTAVVTMCDVLALAVIEEAARRGLRVPEDLSVVGFDDIPEAAAAHPPLTTIAQPIREKGRLAAEIIFTGGPPRKDVLPVALVTRGSTAPPRR